MTTTASKYRPDTPVIDAINNDVKLQFISAFRCHPAGVALITADGQDGPKALTASSVASVSADPPMLMFSASAGSSSTPAILSSKTLIVHLLDEDDVNLAKMCATSGVDRFSDSDLWDRMPTGEVRYHTAACWMKVSVVNMMDANGSTVVLGEVTEAGGRNAESSSAGGKRPLVYHSRSWHVLDDKSKME